MPDGKRKRRQGNTVRARYYAQYRAARFARRFGVAEVSITIVCLKVKERKNVER